MKSTFPSRRRFLQQSSAGLVAASSAADRVDDVNAMKSLHIWDGHCHLAGFDGQTPREKMADMLRFADRMGIERMCVFLGFPINVRGNPEQTRAQNDQVMEAVRHSDGRAFGYVLLNPNYPQACLDELNRSVRDGPMVGVKFEFDTPKGAASPELDPIIARAAELHAVIMHHTWIKTTANEVGESTPMELAALARRHPAATIVCGHTGGTWELGIRAIKDVPNSYGDLAGSDPTQGYTETAVRELGAERVMYGSDVGGRSFASQLGKVMGAGIPDSARRLILGENLRRVLQPLLKEKGIRI